MKKSTEVHFYNWSVSRWLSSDARAELSITERGLYRECLDLCYTNGSIPADPQILARLCHCTPAEIEASWPKIERHFRRSRGDKNRYENTFANTFRRDFFQYKRSQSRFGKSGGRPKVNESNELKRVPFSDAKAKRKEKKRREEKSERVYSDSVEEGSEEALLACSEKPEPTRTNPNQPELRMPTPEEVETVQQWMVEAAGPRAPFLEPPDPAMARSVLTACRGSLENVRTLLKGLKSARRYPEKSWAFYLRIASERFVDRVN